VIGILITIPRLFCVNIPSSHGTTPFCATLVPPKFITSLHYPIFFLTYLLCLFTTLWYEYPIQLKHHIHIGFTSRVKRISIITPSFTCHRLEQGSSQRQKRRLPQGACVPAPKVVKRKPMLGTLKVQVSRFASTL
jgi:hypothetical protein